MRFVSLILAITMLALALVPAGIASAAGDTQRAALTVSPQQETNSSDDDSRVEVQLVVLGVAAFVVVGVGAAGYVLRKRLGLIPPPPGPDAGHH